MGNPKLQHYTTIRLTFKQQQKWTEIPYVQTFMALHQNPNLWGTCCICYAHILPGPPSQEPDIVDNPLLGGSPPPRVPAPLLPAPLPPEIISSQKTPIPSAPPTPATPPPCQPQYPPLPGKGSSAGLTCRGTSDHPDPSEICH